MKRLISATLAWAAAATATAIPVDFDKITHWTGSGPNRAALVICDDAGASDPKAYVWGYRWEDTEHPDGDDMFCAICADSDELVLLSQRTGQYGSTVCGIGFGNADRLLENLYFDFEKAKNSEFINFDYYNASSFFGQKDAPGDDTPIICREAIDKARLSGTHHIEHPLDFTAYGYPAYDYDCWVMSDKGYDHGWWSAAWYEGYWSYWTAASPSSDWTYSGTGFSGRALTDGCVDAWIFTLFDTPQVGGFGEGTPPPTDESLYSYRPARGTTGVSSADASGAPEVRYFDLSGRPVGIHALKPGVYIKVTNGQTEKTIIR
ncbi:MAG: hypothetical protein NC210_01980 [[Clostridium] fimetarium]|nr:hypothetical protein [Alistipes timonensis]MCM1405170.1 hypothetical protein [[Clostridium] fimetarium]